MWQLRAAQARAEVAAARGAWPAALELATASIAASQAHGRVKYQTMAHVTRAHALLALGRKPEALADLRRAVALARPTGDPAMLLRAGAALLAVEGDDQLARDMRATAEHIRLALPDDDMRRRFESAEPVRQALAFR
jgi:hypothetical protein